MSNILILGARGHIARVAPDLFLKQTDARLTLYLRNARPLKLTGHADRVRVVEGDVLDAKALESVMASQDVVYANLAGQLEQPPMHREGHGEDRPQAPDLHQLDGNL